MEGVSVADRRWALTQVAASLPGGRQVLVLWAAGCAQDVRYRAYDEDRLDALDVAIQTATAWAEGCATEADCRDAAPYASAAYAAYAASYAPYASAAYADAQLVALAYAMMALL